MAPTAISMSDKSILLISYYFPPSPSIGGRRWGKLTKYLLSRQWTVDVITTAQTGKRVPGWDDFLDSRQIRIHQTAIPFHPRDYGRVAGKAWELLAPHFIKGYGQDESLFWRRAVLREASRIIREVQPQNLITTGPPHRVHWHACDIKRRWPELHWVCDFRDTWTDGATYAKPSNPIPATKAIQSYETRRQQEVLQLVDSVISVNDGILNSLPKLGSANRATVSHFFDPDDYHELNTATSTADTKTDAPIRFVFGGRITVSAVNDVIPGFLRGLKHLKTKRPDFYERLRFDFYGRHRIFESQTVRENLQSIVRFHDRVTEPEFQRILAREADYPLAMLGDRWKDYVTTKQVYYLPFRKPIALLARPGKAAEQLECHSHGLRIDPDDFAIDLVQFVEKMKSWESQPADISHFSLESVGRTLETQLRQPAGAMA